VASASIGSRGGAGGASRAAAREADGVVDGGEGGDALEEHELIGGHA